jgi:hypothetical protein
VGVGICDFLNDDVGYLGEIASSDAAYTGQNFTSTAKVRHSALWQETHIYGGVPQIQIKPEVP